MDKTVEENLVKAAENAPEVYESGHKVGYQEGKQAEYDRFWDAYQSNGRETGRIYSNAFSYSRFNDEAYNPKYDIICQKSITSSDMMFYNSGLTSTKVPIYILGSRMSQSFSNNPQLVSIPYLHVNESMTFAANPFQDCSALETLIMGGTIGTNGLNLQWSTLLTHDSLMSIINALADKTADTSGTEWVVTIGETNIKKLTEEELNIAYAKGWYVA